MCFNFYIVSTCISKIPKTYVPNHAHTLKHTNEHTNAKNAQSHKQPNTHINSRTSSRSTQSRTRRVRSTTPKDRSGDTALATPSLATTKRSSRASSEAGCRFSSRSGNSHETWASPGARGPFNPLPSSKASSSSSSYCLQKQ